MNSNTPHRPLRSSWRDEAFTKAKTPKGTVMVNRSLGRRSTPIGKINGSFVQSTRSDQY